MGVTSNRMDVRQRAARAEAGLERRAEPLWALFAPPADWPHALLDEAWGLVVRNAAHDSICACSIDPVVDAVVHRYGEAIDLAEGLVGRALRHVGTAAGGTGPIVVNPTARRRAGVVEITIEDPDGLGAPAGTQVLETLPARRLVDGGSRINLGEVVLRTLATDRSLVEVDIREGDDGIHVLARSSAIAPDGAIDHDALRDRIAEVVAAGPPATTVVAWSEGHPALRLLARAELDGFAWRRWEPIAAPEPARAHGTDLGGARLTNGTVTVAVDPSTGTWSLNGVAGYGRLVDGGDQGDTYNWCPPSAGDVLVDRPDAVRISVGEDGPVRATVRIETDWTWPEAVVGGARQGAVATTVVTELALHAGEELLRVTTTIDNRSRDHRLRVHHPLPRGAQRSEAGCAFATVARGLEAEGGPTEAALPTYPARGHVTAGGLTAVVEGVMEYELVAIDGEGPAARSGELALTLLRCTGLLSQVPMETRPVPAGPIVATPGAQMPGRTTIRYGLAVDAADPVALADDLNVPLLVATPRGPHRSDGEQALAVDGAEVSSVRRRQGRLEVRIWNPTEAETTVSVDRPGWQLDLRGRPQARVDGPFPLRPWGIATLSLDG